MTKKIAVINDLSGLGRCSLTAAISVISAMGVQPCPLPTAILSAQTGFSDYYYDDYTEKMGNFWRKWEQMNVKFDGIYTGFISGCRQIQEILAFLDSFHGGETFFLADPVMGDNGARFSIFTEEFQNRMKELVCRADIVTPNLTELCLLAGRDSGEIMELAGGNGEQEKETVCSAAEKFAHELMKLGPREIVVTGIRFMERESGEKKMGNLAVTKEKTVLFSNCLVGGSYSGTGDLFASVIAGGKARGETLGDSAALAGRFIEKAVRDSVKNSVSRNDGVEYEKHLGMLNGNIFRN